MAILAIDTATPALTLALADDRGRPVAVSSAVVPRGHATLLQSALDRMAGEVGVRWRDLRGIIAGAGPGSYTGVRIGVTAAKSFAYALNIPVVAVSTLAAAANAARGWGAVAAVAFDARRGDVYAAAYRVEGGGISPVVPEGRFRLEDFAAALYRAISESGAVAAVTGDAAEPCAEVCRRIGLPVRVAGVRAMVYGEDLLQLGMPLLEPLLSTGEEGDWSNGAHALVPNYIQLAEAEARWRNNQPRSGADE